METRLVVDRIVGGIAVCEAPGRTMVEIPLEQLPEGTKEGDCLVPADRGGYRLDVQEAARRRAANKALLDSLLKKGGSGPQ